jgi:hypothetical protein
MAQLAGAETVELDGSHVIMASRPEPVADMIDRALAAVMEPTTDLPAPRQAQHQPDPARPTT